MIEAAVQAQPLCAVVGTVSQIRFRNEENSFVVISLKADDATCIPVEAKSKYFPDSFTAKGSFARIAVGQHLKLTGKWTRDKYGWGFSVDRYEEILPSTRTAIVDYLSSGLFKGIGPKLAAAIVTAFGDETLKVIKSDATRLATVRGITLEKAQAIVASCRESEVLEELALWLSPFHISMAKIRRICERYGETAKDRISANPYCLCDDFDGIGFKIADTIARHCDISPNDDYRIRAALIHTLLEVATLEGHVFLPFQPLLERTQKTLQGGEISGAVDTNDIARVAVDMRNAEELVVEAADNAVYLPIFHNSETYVARKLQILSDARRVGFRHEMNKVIADLEKKYGIQYAGKQRDAFLCLPMYKVMIITGGPGTGKTTIIKGIIDIYKRNFPGCKISLAAPTGRAAKRMEEATKMEAMTIHRLLEYRPSNDGSVQCMRNEGNPLDTDVLIVDESSMVDIMLCSNLLKAVKVGTTLIFVGDIDQLPSVGPGTVLKDMITSNRIQTVYLTAIFRQSEGSRIVSNASKMNRGEVNLDFGNDFVFIEAEDDEIAPLVKQHCISELAERGDLFEVQVLSPFRRKTELGVDMLNKTLQEAINPKSAEKPEIRYGGHIFRQGDKVMQCHNNYDKGIFNGDMGVVTNVDKAQGLLKVRFDDRTVEYVRDELEELQLSYATTIHKSQGCEYDVVIVPLSMQHKIMLQRNLIYTAVSRAKKKVILIGERKALDYAIRNNHVSMRFTKLKGRLSD